MKESAKPQPAKKNKPKYKRTDIQLKTVKVPVYASPRVADALQEVTEDMDIYKGVRLGQVLEAVYEAGKKKGREEVFEHIDTAKKALPYRAPGKPKKSNK